MLMALSFVLIARPIESGARMTLPQFVLMMVGDGIVEIDMPFFEHCLTDDCVCTRLRWGRFARPVSCYIPCEKKVDTRGLFVGGSSPKKEESF